MKYILSFEMRDLFSDYHQLPCSSFFGTINQKMFIVKIFSYFYVMVQKRISEYFLQLDKLRNVLVGGSFSRRI